MAKVEIIVAVWTRAARSLETVPFEVNLSTLRVTMIACSGKRKTNSRGTATLTGRIDLHEGKDIGGMETVNHREHLTKSKKSRKAERLRKPLGRIVLHVF